MIEDGRIARVARALCVADGNDPEALIDIAGNDVDLGDGMIWHHDAAVPAWTSYASEAHRIIAAMMALGLLD